MNTLTAHEIRMILIDLKGIDDCLAAMSTEGMALSILAHKRVDEVRSVLLTAAMTDVVVEPVREAA